MRGRLDLLCFIYRASSTYQRITNTTQVAADDLNFLSHTRSTEAPREFAPCVPALPEHALGPETLRRGGRDDQHVLIINTGLASLATSSCASLLMSFLASQIM